MTKDEALALLPDPRPERPAHEQIGVYRDALLNPPHPPYHTWWSREDVEFAIATFDVTRTNVVAGHPITIRDGGGYLYIEAKGDRT